MKVRLKLFIALAAVLAITAIVVVPTTLAADRLILATTTSTANSGLLDFLLPEFEAKYNIKVDVIAVGTGQAIKLGEQGDADVLLVHARSAEDKFVADGYGVDRQDVMYNDFVILGPPSDPADVGLADKATGAMKRIANSQQPFVSRGDNSGTHMKEREIWKAAGIEPKGSWYMAVGQGMGASLTMASEKQGYILTDRGTYLSMLDKLDLKIVSEGDQALFNPYGIITVNPKVHAHVNFDGATKLIEWFMSDEIQKKIPTFTVNGQSLFMVY